MHINLSGKGVCELDFSAHDPRTADPKELVALRAIASIDASNNMIKVVRRLDIFASLQSLNLSQNALSSIHDIVQELPLSNLTQLDLSHNRFETIAEPSDPTHFNMSDSVEHLMTAGLRGFLALRSLTWLNLSFNDIAVVDSVDQFRPCFPESLEYLDISFNRISSLRPLMAGLRNLRELHCEGNDIESLEAGGIGTVATQCPQIAHLFLDENPIVHYLGHRFAYEITSALLPHCPNLVSLNGEECGPSLGGATRSPQKPSPRKLDPSRVQPMPPPLAGPVRVPEPGVPGALPSQHNSSVPARSGNPLPPPKTPPKARALRLESPQRDAEQQRPPSPPRTVSPPRRSATPPMVGPALTAGVSEAIPLHGRLESPRRSPVRSEAVSEPARGVRISPARTQVIPDSSSLGVRAPRHLPLTRAQQKYGARIEYLEQHSAELQRLLSETQESVQLLMQENALCEHQLRDRRRLIAAQLKESAALKAERESLRSSLATLKVGMNKTAAELEHAKRAEEHAAKKQQQLLQQQKFSRSQSEGMRRSRIWEQGQPPPWQAAGPMEPPKSTRSHMKLVESTQRKLMARQEAEMGLSPSGFRYYPEEVSDAPLPGELEGKSFDMGSTYFALRPEIIRSDGQPAPQGRPTNITNEPARRLPDPGPHLREPKKYERSALLGDAGDLPEPRRDISVVDGGHAVSVRPAESVSKVIPDLR